MDRLEAKVLALQEQNAPQHPEAEADWAARTGNQTFFLNACYRILAGLFLASEIQYFETEYTDVLNADAGGTILQRERSTEEALRWQNAVIYRF